MTTTQIGQNPSFASLNSAQDEQYLVKQQWVARRQAKELAALNELLLGPVGQLFMRGDTPAIVRGYVTDAHAHEAVGVGLLNMPDSEPPTTEAD